MGERDHWAAVFLRRGRRLVIPGLKDLLLRSSAAVTRVMGPLVFLERAPHVVLGERVSIEAPGGERRRGQVIEISERYVVVQVLESTAGLDNRDTVVHFSEDVARVSLAPGILGRRLSGTGDHIDGIPAPVPEKRVPVTGVPINPVRRDVPTACIQTGMSAIDVMNTLVRGQKLPIFSGAGLPAKEIAAQVLRHATVAGESEKFAVVFAAIGITHRDAAYYEEVIEETGALSNAVVYLNLADDPTIERLLTPRVALTAAEYLAFDRGMNVLVILTDMTNYCEVLREIAAAREEVPGRRGYPGYLYTDLATIYERAGRIAGRPGSVTQLPILTMPDDDMTHPIADLTGYITEGQIVLSRELHRRGVFPPIDVLPSLSRLMKRGIGPGKTREDHGPVADQLYALYARGRELRRLEAIVGEAGLSEEDRQVLGFAEAFEREFVGQGGANRTVEESLAIGWRLLQTVQRERLVRLSDALIDRYGGRQE